MTSPPARLDRHAKDTRDACRDSSDSRYSHARHACNARPASARLAFARLLLAALLLLLPVLPGCAAPMPMVPDPQATPAVSSPGTVSSSETLPMPIASPTPNGAEAPAREATPTPSPATTPMPDPATLPVPSPASTSNPTPSPTPAPAPTLKQTLKPTPTPTPTPVPASAGRVVLAADSRFYYMKLDAALKARITGMSYPADDTGAKIHYDDLRYVVLRHVDFAGHERTGELIVNARLAGEVMKIFHELYAARYPLASVRLVDDFGEPGDDNRSMEANNTSAFNYRRVTGSTTLSRHSLGAAIDVNPLFNPYLHDGLVSPVNATPYVDRSRDFPGKIDHGDLCYQVFRRYGWSWGGDWSGDKDYQHFSKGIG